MQDPFELFKNWLAEAEKREPEDPGAFCLATAAKNGQPSARMLLLKGIDERGFKFHTNAESRKGKDFLENKKAAMCFYWKSTGKQVRIEGEITEAPAEEADEYFASRPRVRQIGAWASQQSRPLKDRDALNESVKEVEKKFESAEKIPRPPYWKGFILKPASIEFWQNDPGRLHDRILYSKENGKWNVRHLFP